LYVNIKKSRDKEGKHEIETRTKESGRNEKEQARKNAGRKEKNRKVSPSL
jgi:hypothetical protein